MKTTEASAFRLMISVAEGSGSHSIPDFRKFLFIPRKSAFECASMLLIFKRREYITVSVAQELVSELESISRMIVAISRTLKG